MEKETLISIIIPIHDFINYIEETVDSILKQTLNELEILIIDDGSKSETKSYLKQISSKDRRIKVYFLTENRGAGVARNFGVSIAKGKYLFFIDGDDLLYNENVLLSLYHMAEEHKVNIAGGSLISIDKDGNEIESKSLVFKKTGLHDYRNIQFDGGFYRFLYQKKFIDNHHIRFPEIKRFEDPVFLVDAFIKSPIFYATSKFVYKYRRNHKRTIWNKENIEDHLIGVKIILSRANKYELLELQYLMAKNYLECLNYRFTNIAFLEKIKYTAYFLLKLKWQNIYKLNKTQKVKITILKLIFSTLKQI